MNGEPLRPASTALEGRKHAEGLASRWDGTAKLVGVAGWRVRRDGRLAVTSDSLWVYTFRRPGDGAYFEVRRDGRGTVDAGQVAALQVQELWEDPVGGWRVDSPVVAEQVNRAQLSVGEELEMQLTQDGVWRVNVEDGQFLGEIWIDARTGRRLL